MCGGPCHPGHVGGVGEPKRPWRGAEARMPYRPYFRVFIDSVVEFPRFLDHQLIDASPKMLIGLLRLQNGGRPEAGFGRESLGNQAQELRGVCLQACKVRGAREGQCIIMNLEQAAHHGDTHGSIVDINLGRFVQ